MLKFLGIGSAFSPDLGNTSAYFLKGNDLYLIDCGSLVFKEIINVIDFNNIKDMNIFITHSHADHIGSLGTLVSYIYNKFNIVANIYHGGIKLQDYLDIIGISRQNYKLLKASKVKMKDFDFEFVKTIHSDRISCFGIKIGSLYKSIYYSGDSSIIPESIYSDFIEGEIDVLYQDVALNINNESHLNINKLSELIPKNMREKVVCMHLNKNSKEQIEKLGFNVAKI